MVAPSTPELRQLLTTINTQTCALTLDHESADAEMPFAAIATRSIAESDRSRVDPPPEVRWFDEACVARESVLVESARLDGHGAYVELPPSSLKRSISRARRGAPVS